MGIGLDYRCILFLYIYVQKQALGLYPSGISVGTKRLVIHIRYNKAIQVDLHVIGLVLLLLIIVGHYMSQSLIYSLIIFYPYVPTDRWFDQKESICKQNSVDNCSYLGTSIQRSIYKKLHKQVVGCLIKKQGVARPRSRLALSYRSAIHSFTLIQVQAPSFTGPFTNK